MRLQTLRWHYARRPWTDAEIKRVCDLYTSGVPVDDICKRLDRAKTSVLNHLSAAGLYRPQQRSFMPEVTVKILPEPLYAVIVENDGWKFSIALEPLDEAERIYWSMMSSGVEGLRIEDADGRLHQASMAERNNGRVDGEQEFTAA